MTVRAARPLADFPARGVPIRADDEDLRLRPASATSSVLWELRELKPELLSIAQVLARPKGGELYSAISEIRQRSAIDVYSGGSDLCRGSDGTR